MKVLGSMVGGLVAAVVVLVGVFAFGMRTKSPRVLGAVRRMNRAYMNPRQRDAGSPGAYASLIGHTGRRTGTSYRTPVVAEATDDGFVIALPYGSQADWLRNVLASGGCAIDHDGVRYDTVAPAIVPMAEAARSLSSRRMRMFGLMGIESFVRLDISNSEGPVERATISEQVRDDIHRRIVSGEHEVQLLTQLRVSGAFAVQPFGAFVRRNLQRRQEQLFQRRFRRGVHWWHSNRADVINASGSGALSQDS